MLMNKVQHELSSTTKLNSQKKGIVFSNGLSNGDTYILSKRKLIVRGSVTLVYLRLEAEYKTAILGLLLPDHNIGGAEPHTIVSCSICCTVHTESGVRSRNKTMCSSQSQTDQAVGLIGRLWPRHLQIACYGPAKYSRLQTCTFIATQKIKKPFLPNFSSLHLEHCTSLYPHIFSFFQPCRLETR